MKVGLVIYGSLDTLSGGYLYDRRLVEYLRAQGDRVELLSLPWRNYALHLTDNLSFRLPRGLDLVIEDELNHPSLIAANRRPHPYPVVSLVHHLRSSELRPAWQNHFYHWVERAYLRSVDCFIFNSQTTRDAVHGSIGAGIPSVVAHPPTDRFDPGISEREIMERAKAADLRIVFLGNVIYRKGLHVLIQAIESKTLGFRLDVVGSLKSEPGYARELRRQVESSGLKSKVFFHGSLDHERLAGFLRSAHVLVVPSSYEGYGIAYLEGMAFGLPAIGTTAGAAHEIITDGDTGYLIPPGDAPVLADRLATLAHDRDRLARMAVNALRRFRAQPKWEQTAGEIRGFLGGFLERSGA